jgi:hypothetical protein
LKRCQQNKSKREKICCLKCHRIKIKQNITIDFQKKKHETVNK